MNRKAISTESTASPAHRSIQFGRSIAKHGCRYPLINWSDLSIGITDFQRKAGLLPPAAAPKK